MAPSIAIIDYGMGNIWSVQNALIEVGAEAEVVKSPTRIADFAKIILPGVGAFSDAMRLLRETGMDAALTERVTQGVPVLGVCLGMQLMCSSSTEEGFHEGLGWIDAEVVALTPSEGIKIPHMGWNNVAWSKDSPLVKEIPDDTDFYFVHSYHVVCKNEEDVLGTATHGEVFTSMVARDNLYAAQFHPEKSQRDGLQMLKNFVELG